METLKYKIGDKVWLISGEKVVNLAVTGILIAKGRAHYFIGECQDLFFVPSSQWRDDSVLYSTKEELLAKL